MKNYFKIAVLLLPCILFSNRILADKIIPVEISISLIWEGDKISQANIDKIKDFRKKFPEIVFIQFLNPAYYLKPGANSQEITSLIFEVLSPKDHIGLNLIPWKTLAIESGVPFRNSPTFWGNKLEKEDCIIDCGHQVPISSYSQLEIEKLIFESKKILLSNKLPEPTYFLAGGWMNHTVVQRAAINQGIYNDFSKVNPESIFGKTHLYPIYHWIADLKENEKVAGQLNSKFDTMPIYVMNNATMDYINIEKPLHNLQAILTKNSTNTNQGIKFHLGFYQETAFFHMERLAKSLDEITLFAQTPNSKIKINFTEEQLPKESMLSH